MADAIHASGIREGDRALADVRVGVLGPLTVHDVTGPIHVGGIHRRRLLAFLASRVGTVVSVDAIVDALWDDDPPPTAVKTLQTHIVRLRRSLDAHADVIETVPGGYRLTLDAAALDAARFERAVDEAVQLASAGDHTGVAATLAGALQLWRGPAYLEFRETSFGAAEALRLDELRFTAREYLAAAQVASGGAIAAVVDLERLVHDAPGRERAWQLLMQALNATGRQHDALGAYQRARRALAEFGLEPGAELRRAERQIVEPEPRSVPPAGTSMLAAALRTSSAMYGREHERTLLQVAWEAAKSGSGQIRILSGPLESGRTRIAADLAGRVLADGAVVEYVRGGDLLTLVEQAPALRAPSAGAIVDHIAARSRATPLLLIVDDAEWATEGAIAAIRALADATQQLSMLLLLIIDPGDGGPAVNAVRRLEPELAMTIEIGPMPPDDIVAIVTADGVDPAEAGAIAATSNGLPGVARREAAAWAERTASERLRAAAASSLGAVNQARQARASVLDEVVELVQARARRDELWSARWAGRQPYRSLTAYGPQDADLFVGRERLVAELAARVLEHKHVAVVGASGSGKSSLVRAGLVPLARSGRLPGATPWEAHVIVPGFDPLAALDAIEDLDAPGHTLLVVDQFEEVFSAAPVVVDRFAQQLVEVGDDPRLDVHVVLVVRSDEYAKLAATGGLAGSVASSQLIVGAPSADELRRIVIEPARRTGVAVEPALVDVVIDDVGGHDAALPLVSAALAEVWERRDGGTLTAATYLEIGGVASAVERLGELAVASVGPEHVDELRSVLLALADITDDGIWTRQRVSVDQLGDHTRAVDALVDARLVVRDDRTVEIAHEVAFRAWPRLARWLEEARSDLVLDRDVRVAARMWDAGDRSDDLVYRGTRLHVALEWADRNAGTAPALVGEFLAAGRQLGEREQLAILDQLERERRARRRLSTALVAGAVLLCLALVAGAVALVSRSRAEDAATLASQRQADAETARGDAEQARIAADDAAAIAVERRAEAEDAQRDAESERDRAQIGRLVAESERQLETQLDRAFLLAVEARQRDDTPATRGALFTALTANLTSERATPASWVVGTIVHRTNSSLLGFLAGRPRVQFDVAVSGDGSTIAAAGWDTDAAGGLVLVFDAATRQEIGRVDTADFALKVVVSPDGRYVVASDGGSLYRLDTTTGETEVRHENAIDMLLHPDGRRLVLQYGGAYSVWDVATFAPVTAARTSIGGFAVLRFASDGSLVAVRRDRNVVDFVEFDTGDVLRSVTLESSGSTIALVDFAVSADQSTLAGSEEQGQVYLWDLATGALEGSADDRPGFVWDIEFHPTDPRLLVLGLSGGGIALYDVVRDRQLGDELTVYGATTRAAAFDAEGDLLVAASDNGLVSLWGRNDEDALVVDRVDEIDRRSKSPALAGDGSSMVVTTVDQSVAIYRLGSDSPPVFVHRADGTQITTHACCYLVSGDGSTFLSGDGGRKQAIAVDTTSGEIVWAANDRIFNQGIWGAAISPDGDLAAMTDAVTLRIWNTRTGELVSSSYLDELSEDHWSALPMFSHDGTHLYLQAGLEVLRFEVGEYDEPERRIPSPTLLGTDAVEVPGSDDIVAGGLDGSLLRWDTATGAVVARGRTAGSVMPHAISVSPDGTLVAVYRLTRAEIELFDAATLTAIGRPFPAGDFVFKPNFTSDSRGLVGNGVYDNEVTLWELDPDVWQERACHAAGRNLTRDEWAEYIGDDEPYRRTCDQWPPG